MQLKENTFDLNKIMLGTAGLAGIWGKVDFEESEATILRALELGITHFDSSPAYADAELILGRALNQWKGPRPFISTKAGKLKSDDPDSVAYDFSPDGLQRSVENSLRLLEIDQIDLLFLHDPTGLQPGQVTQAIKMFQQFKSAGLVKQVGIGGNFGASFRQYVCRENFDFFMGFNRYNLVCRDAKADEFNLLSAEGIKICQASPLYMGLLGRKLPDYTLHKPEWIPEEHLRKANAFFDFCRRENIELPGLALQFLLQSDCLDKVVLGAINLVELEKSISWLADENLRDYAIKLLADPEL